MMRRVSTQQHRRHRGTELQTDEEEEEFEEESTANVDEDDASNSLAQVPTGPDLSSPTAEEPSEMPAEEQEKQEKIEEKKNETPVASGDGPDNQTLLRLLEEGEELQSMFRCARIQVERFFNDLAQKSFFRALNQPKVCCCLVAVIITSLMVILS